MAVALASISSLKLLAQPETEAELTHSGFVDASLSFSPLCVEVDGPTVLVPDHPAVLHLCVSNHEEAAILERDNSLLVHRNTLLLIERLVVGHELAIWEVFVRER